MRKLWVGLLLSVVALGAGTAAVSSQTVTPPKVGPAPKAAAVAATEVILGTPSPNMQARIDRVIAYMGAPPLPGNGPDEGYFPGVTINTWVADFADSAGREAWRWVIIEFIDTGRVIAATDFNNRWRQKAIEANNPVGG